MGLLYCPSDTENGNPRRHVGWIGERLRVIVSKREKDLKVMMVMIKIFEI